MNSPSHSHENDDSVESARPAGDQHTTLWQLREMVRQFVEERNWNQFHSPKNLSMSLAIEAAELMEHFQWISMEQSRRIPQNPAKLESVSEELADVVCYALAIANELNIDISQAMFDKMVKNRRKYPIDQFHGRYGPEDVSLQDP